MKVLLHFGISSDGFIAKPDGDSNWVSHADEERFVARAKAAGCLVVGRTTFEQYQGAIYPVAGVLNLVLTSRPMEIRPEVHYVHSPADAVAVAQASGCSALVVAGGAQTAAAFAEAELLDEVFYSVHPIKLGDGIRPYGDRSIGPTLLPVSSSELEEGVIELRYTAVSRPSK